ncbi:MAG: hypothetical protein FWG70_03395 [Oscillospiraceae bacterium]|nr:hypothetical protein [Oscillospiraceae bacterium]
MTHEAFLRQTYESALEKAFDKYFVFDKIDNDMKKLVECIVECQYKSVLTVTVTLLANKAVVPKQDMRYHQKQLPNGYSARVIDNKYITPFMKEVSFPFNSQSAWLTRSFEQVSPFTLDYPGSISPKKVKLAFLTLIDFVENKGLNPSDVLFYMFMLLIKQRDSMKVELAKPHRLSISAIVELLQKHFTVKYACSGASRLPTLAIYAAYQCMTEQVQRYNGKILCSLENHTSSDTQSGRIGDIDVNNADDTAFEGVEIKHEIIITKALITDSYEKFKIHNTDRYYLLTTANMESADWTAINEEVQRIAHIHGCQVIVNGVYDTLKYYLRLLDDTADFIDHYVECMKADTTIKFQHKTMWNDIVGGKI